VLTPLRTSTGTRLVARGVVAARSDGTPPTDVSAPPAGPVQVIGRLQTPSSSNDAAAALGGGLIASINPVQQAARLAEPVYNAYLSLNAAQPGTSGLTALPAPDLSNPAGGAYVWQHFAYIIQWYLFALLALAAPFVIARHEVYEARRDYLGLDPARQQLDELDELDAFGELESGGAGADAGGALVRRDDATLARRGDPTPEQWQRAARLADRYGRSLGTDYGSGPGRRGAKVRSGAGRVRPPQADDGQHGSYNDYLAGLAQADAEPQDNPTDLAGRRPPADDD
jgi:hypothetical protein